MPGDGSAGRLGAIDATVLVAYLLGVVVLGMSLARRSRTSDAFMTAGRSLGGWAVGLSMFGSYISSISFLANPGKAYSSNWNALVFSLATPLAALFAVRYFVPFYRNAGHVSAYEHLERRFGPWARTYAVVCFLLTQTARTGAIIYLLALSMGPLLGLAAPTVIVAVGALITCYTVAGGLRAVVWTGVVQSFVLLAGPVGCLVVLLTKMPGGLAGVLSIGTANDKFSLGSYSLSFDSPTVWVTLLYGLAINVSNFAVDQSYIQRYISARSDHDAARSVWLTAALYPPVAAAFFFIGTGLFAFYALRPELLPSNLDAANQADAVFPHFIAHVLPAGLTGLVIAAIFAAAMDSTLGSMATLTLCDVYQRYVRPNASQRESILVLRAATLAWGAVATCAALAMIGAKSILDAWWELAGLFAAPVLGLVLLGRFSRRASGAHAAWAVGLGTILVLWMTLSTKSWWPSSLPRSPLHENMTVVVGTLFIVGMGLAAVLCSRRAA